MNEFYHKGEDAYPAFRKWLDEGKNLKFVNGLKCQVSACLGPKPVDLCDRFGAGRNRVQKIQEAVGDLETPVSEVFSTLASDEPMISTIEALAFDIEHIVVVNIPNTGESVPGIPKDYECECKALVSKRDIQGIRMQPLPLTSV